MCKEKLRNKATLMAKGSSQQQDVYVEQPLGFEGSTLPKNVFKLNKYLYGLKQAPRAWYERLSNFLVENDFKQQNGHC